MTTLPLRKSTNRSPLRLGVVLSALAWFAVSPTARAVNPPPDGGYPGDNTAEGQDALFSLTTGHENTAIGFHALYDDTSGSQNTAVGREALSNNTSGAGNTAIGIAVMQSNTTGLFNTATGWVTLGSNQTGNYNTATGVEAMLYNFSGSFNTAVGSGALSYNNADNNTATGYAALSLNTTGNNNTATGFQALLNNNADNNTASGYQALYRNTNGTDNTAIGVDALLSNNTGNSNTASGSNALQLNTAGSNNTANGLSALFSNSTGNNNTASGVSALASNTSGHDNLAAGSFALFQNKMGSFNIALGSNAGVNLTGSNNIDIGAAGAAGESGKIRIGKQGTQNGTFIAGIFNVPVTGSPVVVNSNGKLGVASSSARFKEAITPMDKASEAIMALKPVSFRYKEEIDPDGIPQFGLIAEEVEKVNPDLITRDESGRPVTVRYDAVNAMLLNEFLKEHRRAEEQGCRQKEEEAAIYELKSIVARQQKEINALTTSLRTVSDEVERSKVAPELVADNH